MGQELASQAIGQYIRCYRPGFLPLKRRCAAAALAGMMMFDAVASLHAQAITPDPATWRLMSYANLQTPAPQTATYLDIWKDVIDANNRAYQARGDLRFAGGNAPATEAHFVIWSPAKAVVLSILDTATGCTLKEMRAAAGITIKLCPLRIAIYEGVQVRTLDGGRACFLELATTPASEDGDRERTASYASYDVATKTVRTGIIIDHQVVDGCSQNIALYPP